jgi:hypothetical protein
LDRIRRPFWIGLKGAGKIFCHTGF